MPSVTDQSYAQGPAKSSVEELEEAQRESTAPSSHKQRRHSNTMQGKPLLTVMKMKLPQEPTFPDVSAATVGR